MPHEIKQLPSEPDGSGANQNPLGGAPLGERLRRPAAKSGCVDLVSRLGTLDGLYYLWWPLHDGYLARWWDGAGQEVDLLRSRLFRQSDIDLEGVHAGYIPIEAGLAAA